MTDTPITVSDGQPVSLQKEDTFASRERSSHMGTDTVGQSPVAGAFDDSRKELDTVVN